ncbi:MAG: hypothetical protein V2I40_09790 [Desulfobacteraceae bacterium]|nr:hypothetical protein [Desulfobacteraceae bacterium]
MHDIRRTPIRLKMIVRWGIVFLLSASYLGCGVKGPPVPRSQPPVPAVVDLAYTAEGQRIALAWRLSGPLSAKQASQAAFGLYRSRTALAESGCDGCPLVFERVATVPYVHTAYNRYTIDAPLEPGYRYVFNVRLETDGGAGPDSNPVQIDHLSDTPSEVSETP